HLCLKGFHCHIGSQIFEKLSFSVATEKMLNFAAALRSSLNFTTEVLNMGGGFGVWYTEEDAKNTPAEHKAYLQAIIQTVKTKCAEHKMPLPKLYIEPGRSIVGEAGITLYTAGNIKEIPAVRKYVAIDGGMFENPRHALYGSKYTVILANRANNMPCERVSLAGKCCESGDLIAKDVNLPVVKEGDLIAVFTTGAYHYSMASNYNRNLIPPAVLVKDGKAEYIVKPQSYADLVRNDALPDYLNK
ncbi:MAG: diaminopimelate decarboxylase, partial [Clostridia bacterium]|nr:diaminopimelate decarboxylase [Clostridia bacterium]